MHRIAIATYIASITIANLLVANMGPSIIAFNAFVFIGLDLVLRDYLHDAWQTNRTRNMLLLIAAAGATSYALNQATITIAAASTAAFSLAAITDWAAYHAMRNTNWTARTNTSNAAAAVVDSVTFPTIAFGAIMPEIVAAQIVAKIAGGAVWSFVIGRARRATANHHSPTHNA